MKKKLIKKNYIYPFPSPLIFSQTNPALYFDILSNLEKELSIEKVSLNLLHSDIQSAAVCSHMIYGKNNSVDNINCTAFLMDFRCLLDWTVSRQMMDQILVNP